MTPATDTAPDAPYVLPTGRALLLKTVDAGMRAYGGFLWPESGKVVPDRWDPAPRCGDGLHGALFGEGDGGLFRWAADARWLVVEVDATEVVDLHGKVKVPSGVVVHCGDRQTATTFLTPFAAGRAVIGSTLTGGCDSTLTGGGMTTTGPVTLTDVPTLSMGRHVTVGVGPMGHILLTLTCDGVPVEVVALSDTQAAEVADGLRALVLLAEECRAAGREGRGMSTVEATTRACAEHGCGHRAQAHVTSPRGEWCSVEGCRCDGFVPAGGQQPAPAPRRAVIDAEYLAHQRDWSAATFGPGFRLGVLDHLAKELEEVRAAPLDLGEWVDLVILAFDGAWRAGHSPQHIIDAIVAKQARNEARTWPDWRTTPSDTAIEHDRSVPEPSTPITDARASGGSFQPMADPYLDRAVGQRGSEAGCYS